MNLPPAQKGTYVLVMRLENASRLEIGRLGAFPLRAGHYLYVGSALGSGGLTARIGHHLDPDTSLTWHIDYLITIVEPLEVWFVVSDLRVERDWVQIVSRMKGTSAAVAGFGASDHRRPGKTHLFYTRRVPSFTAFRSEFYKDFSRDLLPQVVSFNAEPEL